MNLTELLKPWLDTVVSVAWSAAHNAPAQVALDCACRGMTLDSRAVQAGDVFVALQGEITDGKNYVAAAISAGAVAVLADASLPSSVSDQCASLSPIPVVVLPGLAGAVSALAARLYGDPSQHCTVVGVTGTNGKTSVVHILAQLLTHNGQRVGVLGTAGNGLYPALAPSPLTTLDPIAMQKTLADYVASGAQTVLMEVSSHALAQGRVAAVAFDYAVFTNLSQDHLDYHGTMAAYAQEKCRLFLFDTLQARILNAEDACCQSWMAGPLAAHAVTTYAVCDVGVVDANVIMRVEQAETTGEAQSFGTTVQVCESATNTDVSLTVPLIGRYNMENVVASLTCLRAMGWAWDQLLPHVSLLHAPPGRLQYLRHDDAADVVIDFAHTPDALEKVLRVCRAQNPTTLWVVFGCGGDRDRAKRPMMAAIAEQHADQVVLTSDNPRREALTQIFEDVMSGFSQADSVHVIEDRAEAVRFALQSADKTDLVVLAGKGDELYQKVGDAQLPYSEEEAVQLALQHRAGENK